MTDTNPDKATLDQSRVTEPKMLVALRIFFDGRKLDQDGWPTV